MSIDTSIPESPGEKWSVQLDAYGKTYKPWLRRMDKVVQRYRDERDSMKDNGELYVDNWTAANYNILYSNTSVLQPATYNHTPQPVVSRRYADKDPVARVASEILQRCISTTIEPYFDQVMEAARDDFLMGGRGTTWVRYEPRFGTEPIMIPVLNDETGQMVESPVLDDDGEEVFPLIGEYACADFVEAKDFAHTPVRKWQDVTWVARRHYFTKEEAVKSLGEKAAKKLKYIEHSTKPVSTDTNKQTGNLDGQKKAEVWEIWDKTSKKVIFWSDCCKEDVLKEVDPPMDFQDFFPCPKPCYGILTNGSLVPVPYYCEYQDQARELDNLTARMDNLLGACKVSGIYDTTVGVDLKAMMQSFELTMTPVDNLAQKYAEKGNGSLDSFIKFYPIDVFAKVYDQLRMAREQIKRDIDEITGISDIVRGYSAPNATATAEQIKSSYATLRLDKMKTEVARFARDTIRLLAEIICEGFQPETIIDMAGVEFMDEQSIAVSPQAIQLLKNDKQRSFRVDIETDSTVAMDETQDKADRLEFLTTMAGFLEGSMKIGQQAPELAPLLKESIMFAVRSFKAGRSMEGNFEQALQAMVDKSKQPQQPPVDPAIEKVKIEGQIKQQEAQQNAQLDQAKAIQDAQLSKQKAQQDAMLAQVKAQTDMRTRQMEVEADIAAREREAMAEIASKERIALAEIAMQARIDAMKVQNEPTGQRFASE